jgi:hypothetical protein
VPRAEALKTAVARAIRFIAGSREPHALLWLEHMRLRFGIEAFAGSLQRFDELLAEEPQEAPLLRVFRRMADPGNPLRFADLEAVSHMSDRIIVSALYCDRLNLPASFVEVLGEAARRGGYYCTHALLAWVWIQEYGGRLTVPAGFVDELLDSNAAIVDADTGMVTDLKLEAAAFLYLAGQGVRVDPAFVDAVIKVQNADGGWGMTRGRPGVSAWHGTVLGLLLLLQVQRAANA